MSCGFVRSKIKSIIAACFKSNEMSLFVRLLLFVCVLPTLTVFCASLLDPEYEGLHQAAKVRLLVTSTCCVWVIRIIYEGFRGISQHYILTESGWGVHVRMGVRSYGSVLCL